MLGRADAGIGGERREGHGEAGDPDAPEEPPAEHERVLGRPMPPVEPELGCGRPVPDQRRLPCDPEPSAEDLALTIHPHPTMTETVME